LRTLGERFAIARVLISQFDTSTTRE
jgi:hypothetical protein